MSISKVELRANLKYTRQDSIVVFPFGRNTSTVLCNGLYPPKGYYYMIVPHETMCLTVKNHILVDEPIEELEVIVHNFTNLHLHINHDTLLGIAVLHKYEEIENEGQKTSRIQSRSSKNS